MKKINTWAGFHRHNTSPRSRDLSCRLGGEVFPFEAPEIDPMELVGALLKDPQTRILEQKRKGRLDLSKSGELKYRHGRPEEVARSPHLHLSLFDLSSLMAKGQILEKVKKDVVLPMARHWKKSGVNWKGKLWPILFVSGSKAATNYHIDPTETLTFHLFGEKRYGSLKKPRHWCSDSEREYYSKYQKLLERPKGLKDADCLFHDNAKGDLVWTPALMPHWVDSFSLSATLTFAFRETKFSKVA